MFMHNGHLEGWQRIRRTLLGLISDRVFGMIQGTSDTAAVFGLFLSRHAKLFSPARLPRHSPPPPAPQSSPAERVAGKDCGAGLPATRAEGQAMPA